MAHEHTRENDGDGRRRHGRRRYAGQSGIGQADTEAKAETRGRSGARGDEEGRDERAGPRCRLATAFQWAGAALGHCRRGRENLWGSSRIPVQPQPSAPPWFAAGTLSADCWLRRGGEAVRGRMPRRPPDAPASRTAVQSCLRDSTRVSLIRASGAWRLGYTL